MSTERFTYQGSVISSDEDVEADINTQLAKAAAVFQRLDNVWRSSMLKVISDEQQSWPTFVGVV